MSAISFHRRRNICFIPHCLSIACLTIAFNGCGSKSNSSTGDATTPANGTSVSVGSDTLPTASISATDGGDDGEDAQQSAPIRKGSAEWLLREITKERVQPLPDEKDFKRFKQVRQERNLKIIDLATEAIAQTHENPEQERLFTLAVHHLMESRLELALTGDEDQIDAMYDDAASLYERNPTSRGAEEAAFVLIKFAQSNANRFADQEPRWLEEFARQARSYANNFPQDILRGPNALFAAAESCELHGQIEEAKICYTLLQQRYPDHLLAAQAIGILRRISAVGQPLSLGGPTLEGGYLTLDELKGKPILIVFWSSQAKRFLQSVAALKAIEEKYVPQGLQVVGVNLDLDEDDVQSFIDARQIDWPQIFFPQDEQRGWNHPVANYYGIRQVPAFWLVDGEGIVQSTEADVDRLDAQLAQLLKSQ